LVRTLCGIHLSDNGIKRDEAVPEDCLMHDLIEIFGIDENIFLPKHHYIINKTTSNPDHLERVVNQAYQPKINKSISINDAVESQTENYLENLILTRQNNKVK
jgi:hypothetical protein